MLGIKVTDPWGLAFMIVSIALSLAVILYGFIPWIVEKKYPVRNWIATVNSGIKKIETILTIVGKNDKSGRYTEKLQMYNSILKVTRDAVCAAEQLYKANELAPEQRKEYAINYTKRVIQMSGVTITPEVTHLIEDCIESSVMFITGVNKK